MTALHLTQLPDQLPARKVLLASRKLEEAAMHDLRDMLGWCGEHPDHDEDNDMVRLKGVHVTVLFFGHKLLFLILVDFFEM